MDYTAFDKELTKSVLFVFIDERGARELKLQFQFPPKISSDNRKGEWEEGQLQGTEPNATFKTSGPRELTLNVTYIVDGGLWTTTAIAEEVRKLRGYFARVRKPGYDRNLVVLLHLWKIGGKDPMSFRIKGVDVKHSDTIVSPSGRGKDAYPLRTDINIDLRLWTEGGPQATQTLPKLVKDEVPDWY